MKPKHFQSDLGWVRRELRELRRLIKESNAAKRLQAATIGKGGLTVKGGNITLAEGGVIRIRFPLNVAPGLTAAYWGNVYSETDGSYMGSGVLLQTADGEDVVKMLTEPGNPDRGRVEFGEDDTPLVLLWGHAENIFMKTPGDVTFDAADWAWYRGATGVWIESADGPVQLEGERIEVFAPITYFNAPTTSAGANINYDFDNGRLRVVTSSVRHKDVIGPAALDLDACAQLMEMAYTRKDEAGQEDPKVYYGFLAEQAHDLGLSMFVAYDSEGLPYSFDYPTFAAVVHQAMIRDLRARVTTLEGA